MAMKRHPQHTYRAIRPAVQPASEASNSSSSDDTTSRESVPVLPRKRPVAQACHSCRKAKTKCDGEWPTCSSCLLKGRECGYDEVERQQPSHITTLRLGVLEKLVCTLRLSSPDQAGRLLHSLRTASDPLAAFGDFSPPETKPELSVKSLVVAADEDQTSSPDPTQASDTPSSNPTSSMTNVSPDDETRYAEKPMLQEQQMFGSHTSHGTTSRYSCSPAVLNLPSWKTPPVPDLLLARQATNAFFECSGKLFHIFSEEEVHQFQDAVSDRHIQTSSDNLKANYCSLMAVAAVGSQYLDDDEYRGIEKGFYDNARYYVDEIIEYEPLDALKVCTLLAMYNIFEKSTVSLAYIEIGLGLCRKFELEADSAHTRYLPDAKLADYRKSWRTLIFFSSWLASTVGYMSGNDLVLRGISLAELEVDNSHHIENIVQTELTKICVLKSGIIRMHISSKEFTPEGIQSILDDLQSWYAELPQEMRLDYASQDTLPREIKRSIFHVHLFYLGAIMLLYRRTASQFVRPSERTDWPEPLEALVVKVGNEAILAGTTSARILKILLEENNIYKRCWMVIFAAYVSGIMILHSACQKQLHKFDNASRAEDIERAKDCLAVLSYCGSLDRVAARFHGQVASIFDQTLEMERFISPNADMRTRMDVDDDLNLSRSDIAALVGRQEQQKLDSRFLLTLPMDAEKKLLDLAFSVLVMICRPFDNPSNSTYGDILLNHNTEDALRKEFPQLVERLHWGHSQDVKLRRNLTVPQPVGDSFGGPNEVDMADSSWGTFIDSEKLRAWSTTSKQRQV